MRGGCGKDAGRTGEGAGRTGEDAGRIREDAERTGEDAGRIGEDAGRTGEDARRIGEDAGRIGEDGGRSGEDAVVRGEAMLRVIVQEAQKKNLNINQGVWPSWMGASGPASQDHGDRVLTAGRQQLHEESAGAVMDTVRYQSSIGEVTAAVATQTSLTTTVDGLATGLLQWGGLRVLQNVQEFLRQDMGHLPCEVFQALHLPYRKSYEQQMVQYRRLQVLIQTALGLVLRGVVPGGGMDPFFYVWNSLLLCRGINERCRGVLLTLLWGAQVAIKAQATVDDTTLWASSPAELQRAVEQVMPVLKAMNAAVNPHKFGLLHLSGAQGQVRLVRSSVNVHPKVVHSATEDIYVKVLGSNANLLSTSPADVVALRRQSYGLQRKLRLRTPSLPLLLPIAEGVLLVSWCYKRMVHSPRDLMRPLASGEGAFVLSILCRVLRKVVILPPKTPRQFLLHSRGLRLSDPYHKLWELGNEELMRAANSRHRYVRETTQSLIVQHCKGLQQQTPMGNDYVLFAEWCQRHSWSPELRYEQDADAWEATFSANDILGVRTLIIVADVSGSEDQEVWGFAACVATPMGHIVALFRAWMRVMYAGTMLSEATAVVNALRARLGQISHAVEQLLAGADNKQAVEKLANEGLSFRAWDL